MSSTAEHLFERIIGNPVTELQRMVADKELESEFLDYKVGKLPDQDRKVQLAKALSAFANTGGGVLIWGINCRQSKTGRGLDEPLGLVYCEDATKFAQQIQNLLIGATDNFVEGVKVRGIEMQSHDGCVVCLVPEGRSKPYRSLYGEKQYFQRIGDRSSIIEHSLLRSLFFPQVSPKPVIEIAFGMENSALRLSFRFVNEGTASSRLPFVKWFPDVAVSDLKLSGLWSVRNEAAIPKGIYPRQMFKANETVHPGETQEMFTALHNPPYGFGQILINFIFDVFSEDAVPRRLRVAISFRDLQRFNGIVRSEEIDFDPSDVKFH